MRTLRDPTGQLLLPLSLLSFLAAFVSTALANAIRLLALVATPIGSERLENVLSRAAGHAEFRLTPNEFRLPVVKWVNDILKVAPVLASI